MQNTWEFIATAQRKSRYSSVDSVSAQHVFTSTYKLHRRKTGQSTIPIEQVCAMPCSIQCDLSDPMLPQKKQYYLFNCASNSRKPREESERSLKPEAIQRHFSKENWCTKTHYAYAYLPDT